MEIELSTFPLLMLLLLYLRMFAQRTTTTAVQTMGSGGHGSQKCE